MKTKEQIALGMGYIPDKNGVVKSPYNEEVKGYVVNPRAKLLGIKIKDPESNKLITVYKHRLVWTYFNGPIPEGAIVVQKNNIKTDNRLENLMLATA